MMPRFCVLASGSSGNAAFVQADGFGVLIDMGLGPRLLASRLAAIGASWRNVNAVLLTHVHADHWRDRTLAHLRTHSIPLWCHATHSRALSFQGPSFDSLTKAGLVHHFEPEHQVELPRGFRCVPIPVSHDSDPTFAFRIEGSPGLFGAGWSLGYAADLGIVPSRLVELFQDVHLLALEFNHDEEMERTSGRPRHLIDRVLGDQGHLSNRQAAESLRDILESTPASNLQHVVQLHLSHQCNRPALAQSAARDVLNGRPIKLHTAMQDRPTKVVELKPAR
jgi:phosphoribosyl 1,2-cyclic phosphodiesterase